MLKKQPSYFSHTVNMPLCWISKTDEHHQLMSDHLLKSLNGSDWLLILLPLFPHPISKSRSLLCILKLFSNKQHLSKKYISGFVEILKFFHLLEYFSWKLTAKCPIRSSQCNSDIKQIITSLIINDTGYNLFSSQALINLPF